MSNYICTHCRHGNHQSCDDLACWCNGCDHKDGHAADCPLLTETCPLCGCTGYLHGGGCGNCYCHDKYPNPCAECGGGVA